MRTPELLHLISLLSKSEMRRADQFLQSPYHNNSELVLKLFQYLKKYHPKMNSYRLQKEHIFDHVYPGEIFDERRLKNPIFMLKKSLEEFLRIEQLKTEPNLQNRLLVSAYYEKCSYDEIEKLIDDCIADLKKQSIRDARYYQAMLWLREERYYHPGNRKYKKNGLLFGQLLEQLNHYYTLVKYRFVTDLHVRKAVLNEDQQEKVTLALEEAKCLEMAGSNELTQLYYQLHAFQKKQIDHNALASIIEMMPALFAEISMKEKSFLLSCFINSASLRYNRGETNLLPGILALYRLADAEDLILYRGKMQASTFLNIICYFTVAEELDWAKAFIQKYQHALSEEEKQDTLNLAWVYWYFHARKGEMKKTAGLELAQEHLALVSYSDLSINLRLRSLQLRIYFELDLMLRGNSTAFLDYATSFKRWLDRTELLSPAKKENYANLIKYSNQLAKIISRDQADRQQLLKVKTIIEQDQKIALKGWLLERVEELLALLHP